ncbi:MAG: alanine/glycine:cation symporter family protein [Hungatella sp.]
MEQVLEVVKQANGFLWDVLLIVILCGTGIYYTIRLNFIQVRKLGEGFRLVFGNMSLNGKKNGRSGEMTPFQSVATAIAAQVGTGNLAGAATALIGGGPGAIFWMWVSAFFGMATIYAEATLAQEYKTMVNGQVTGGPIYYIRQAFRGIFGKVLAGVFAGFIILALGFMGNMVQSNSIGSAFTEVFQARNLSIPPVAVGVLLAFFAGMVFFGGTEDWLPWWKKSFRSWRASVILIGMNITMVPEAIRMIFVGAFRPEAILGGTAGVTVKEAVRYGVARGLFSNEAGMGSTPHAHARATAKNPHAQGLAAMVSVFIDTFVILNLTVFAVLTTNVMSSGKDGTALTQAAFMSGFGRFGDVFVAVCLLFFAFSTILGWHFFGSINVEYLFGKKAVKVYSMIVLLFIVIGSTLKVELVWSLADFFNGLMVIPNAMALLALGGVVVKISKKYSKRTD